MVFLYVAIVNLNDRIYWPSYIKLCYFIEKHGSTVWFQRAISVRIQIAWNGYETSDIITLKMDSHLQLQYWNLPNVTEYNFNNSIMGL